MKQIIVKDIKLSLSNSENLLHLTEKQTMAISNAILYEEFNKFSQRDLQIFQSQRATLLVSDSGIMTAEMYAGLMGYFFNEKAFSEEEKTTFLYPIFDRELTQKELFITADELLTFKAYEYLPLLRKVIKDTIVKDMSDSMLIVSVRFALLEQINKL